MGEVIKLKMENQNPMSWSVEDALERALEQVRSGEFDCDKVYVALSKTPSRDDEGGLCYTMAGMNLAEAIGWLHIHAHRLLSTDS